MTVANNHSLDFGSDALAESIALLQEAGIHTCGHSPYPDIPGTPAIFTANGVRFGMIGFCDQWRIPATEKIATAPVAAMPGAMEKAVADLVPQVDICIVQIHWGYEFSLHPLRSHRDIARTLAEAGADLVLCHHAHVPMGVERFGNSVIAHGLGNFLMPPDDYMSGGHHWSERSFVLKVSFSREGIHEADVIPHFAAAGPSVHLQPSRSRSFFLRALARMSHSLHDTQRLDRCERIRAVYESHRTARGLFNSSGSELVERALLLTTPCCQQSIHTLRSLRSAAAGCVANFFEMIASEARSSAALSGLVEQKRNEVQLAIERMTNSCYRWQDALSARVP